ncbi:MAG: AMP-binding protein [Planctomycetota bacterium]|nr:AMP-binding protein [Planctomycetota bacterium]
MHPRLVRHLVLPIHERLCGRDTVARLAALEASQWWSGERLGALQTEKLRALLRRAYDRSPFYRRRMDDAGVNPDRVTLETLRRMPRLSKDQIAENVEDMLDPTVPGGLHRCSTGGSTGSPLIFWIDRPRQAADQAGRARTRRWFGIDLGERELYLWGSPVEHSMQDWLKGVRDRVTNHRLLNAFRLTPKRMTRYLTEIRRFDPVHLFGYPSSIATLVRHARTIGKPVQTPSLKCVFTTGEVLHPSDRGVIEESVAVPIADGYGSREAGFVAHQCPEGSYHVTMESLIVELLDASGRPVEAGKSGEVTITHLDALGMPFIRYQTGDIARRSAGVCRCGRGLETLERIEGRRTDMLRTQDGGYAHALSAIYVLRDEPAVAQFKVVQRKDLNLDVYVVERNRLDPMRRRHAQSLLASQLGKSIEVRINVVSRIPPDPSGKHRYVISEAP